jgi:glutaconate CoA-transferase, subunit A
MTDSAAPVTRWHDTVGDLLAGVPDGARVGMGGFHFTRIPVAQLLELRRRRELTYVAWGGGLALELLLDAGAVSRAELTFSSLDVFGLAPRFRRAVEDGTLALEEWTALGMISALQARSRGLDFEVMQRLAGTDLGATWARPLDDRQAAVPALPLDVFLLHAGRADEAGNVELRGARGIDLSALFAADRVLVTVEERVGEGELDAPGAFIVPRTFVSGLAVAEDGAYPTSCLPHYGADLRRLRRIAAVPAGAPLYESLLAPDTVRVRAAARFAPDALRAAFEGAPAEDAAAEASRAEVMVCALARTVRPGDVATVGSASPLPTVAYLLAKLLWAPDLVLLSFNGGLVDVGWRPMTLSYAELLDFHSAAAHAGGDETYHWYYQQGRVTHEVVGAAQIDRDGATNNIAVRRRDGSTVRLPGQGGMADVANLHASFLLYLPRQSRRNTVERVDIRSAARVRPGRTAVLTDLGRFELDKSAGGLVLTHLHPGVELDEVRERTGWPLLIGDDLQRTPEPSAEELHALRERVDPLGVRRLDFVPAAERGALIDELLDREDRLLDAVAHAEAAA